MGYYEIKPPIYIYIYIREYYRENYCIHTNGMLENELMYLHQIFQFHVIIASTT